MDSLQVDSSPSKELSRKISPILDFRKFVSVWEVLETECMLGQSTEMVEHLCMNEPLWRSIEA